MIDGREAFERLTEPHRQGIQLHCYRMLGSVHDAEDATQDTLLRAWRGHHAFEGRSSVRTWLYRIATNVCLRSLERRAGRVLPESRTGAMAFEPLGDPDRATAWLEPYPISAVELATDPAPGPEARHETREAIQLAFVAAIQALPPRQRAVLLLRDVIGLSSHEAAAALETSTASINSALQRARSTLRRRYPAGRAAPVPAPDERTDALLERYVRAWEAADIGGLVALLAEDAVWTMPPWRQWFVGPEPIAAFLAWVWRPGRSSQARLVAASANGQPAFGYYRASPGEVALMPFAIQVLSLGSDRIRSVTNFVDAGLFATFGLPPSLPVQPATR